MKFMACLLALTLSATSASAFDFFGDGIDARNSDAIFHESSRAKISLWGTEGVKFHMIDFGVTIQFQQAIPSIKRLSDCRKEALEQSNVISPFAELKEGDYHDKVMIMRYKTCSELKFRTFGTLCIAQDTGTPDPTYEKCFFVYENRVDRISFGS